MNAQHATECLASGLGGAAGRVQTAPADTAIPADLAQDLAVLARARWPAVPGDTLTPIPAFVASSFNPLVAEVANRCLRAHYAAPPADPARGCRTAIVLASRHGDVGTGDEVAHAIAARRRVAPLLFFQSNVNAVVGHVAARWGLAGPVVCTSPRGDPLADGLACAALLFLDGDASEALVIAADQAHGGESDSATAVLVAAQTKRPCAGHSRAGRQEPGGIG